MVCEENHHRIDLKTAGEHVEAQEPFDIIGKERIVSSGAYHGEARSYVSDCGGRTGEAGEEVVSSGGCNQRSYDCKNYVKCHKACYTEHCIPTHHHVAVLDHVDTAGSQHPLHLYDALLDYHDHADDLHAACCGAGTSAREHQEEYHHLGKHRPFHIVAVGKAGGAQCGRNLKAAEPEGLAYGLHMVSQEVYHYNSGADQEYSCVDLELGILSYDRYLAEYQAEIEGKVDAAQEHECCHYCINIH